jgi:large subunit ribosomal protein L18|tara:strand:+ start:1531 stop:1905 length:375 start_codon:yes stop_codon:yes gene_type:complete
MTAKRITPTQRRALRTRTKVKTAAIRNGRPRLSVYRSNNHISAQIIDDTKHVTLASASTIDTDLKGKLKEKTGNADAATAVGKLLAERAKKAGIKEVIFDRGSYVYHGRVKALADAAREGGLEF